MPVDQLSTTFAALADPTRRAILARLISGERSVTELAEPFDMSMPAVSKHLRVLERAGLIARGREAQWRPCRIDAVKLVSSLTLFRHVARTLHEQEGLDAYAAIARAADDVLAVAAEQGYPPCAHTLRRLAH